MSERDYIGTDPVKWLDRLVEVNDGAAFDPYLRRYIGGRLRELREKVKALKAPARAAGKDAGK